MYNNINVINTVKLLQKSGCKNNTQFDERICKHCQVKGVWERANYLMQWSNQIFNQPRSQGLRGETLTKTLVKFILSFQNFGEKIACAVRHNRIAITVITVEYGCVSLRMRFFSQNFGMIKRILPGSSSPSHREGPGIEVDI